MNEYDLDSEDSIDLSPEEQAVAAAIGLGVNTKRLSKKAYAEFKKKAEDIVAQSSVPSKTAREAAKGIVKGGGQKSAEVSARAFEKALEKGPIKVPSGPVISDLPSVSGKMGAAMEKAAAAAKGMPWSPAEGVINLPSSAKPSFLQRIASLASNPSNQKTLAGIGLGAGTLAVLSKLTAPVQAVSGLYGGEGEGPEPNDPYLNPPKKVDYTPSSTEKSDLNPPMSSSMYDSLGGIIADTTRPPVAAPESAALADSEAAKEVLAPKPRMISAGEPTVAQVAKQAETAQLDKILNQKSDYEDLLARYKEAEERQKQAQLGVALGQAGERIGSAIAMVKPGDQSIYEQMMKQAGGITDQFKEEEAVRKEAQERDPTSPISKQYQAMATMMGIKTTGSESAAVLKQTMPFLEKYMQAKETRAARLDERQMRLKEFQLRREELGKTRSEKEFGQLYDALDPTKGRAGQFGEQYKIVAQADRLGGLIDKTGYGMDLTGPEMEELALGTAKLLSGTGASSRAQIEALVPHTGRGMAADILSWIKNEPMGRKQQEFVKRTKGLLDREKGLAQEKLESIIRQRAKTKSHLQEQDPDKYQEAIDSAIETFVGKKEGKPEASLKQTRKLEKKMTGAAGKTFTDSTTGKTYRINPDEISATEI